MKKLNSFLEIFLMVAIAIMWLFPLPVSLFLYLNKKPLPPWTAWIVSKSLTGMQNEEQYPARSWKNVFNAKYQAGIANEFNDKFAGRELLIRLNNEIYFRVLKTCAIDTGNIVVGKDNELFESNYLEEYCLERPSRTMLAGIVSELKRFQEECERRGIAFVLVITPSKASLNPGSIPTRWMERYDPRPRGYDILVPLLKKQGIHFVDGHAIALQVRTQLALPLFPKGGIHWTEEVSLPVANAVIASMRSQGKNLADIDKTGLYFSSDYDFEYDLERVLNRAVRSNYPVLRLKPKALMENPVYNMAAVGGSFVWNLTRALCDTNQFSEIDCFYYYTVAKYCYVFNSSWKLGRPVKPVDFDREIYAADCVMIEVNEQQIPGNSSMGRFLPDALANMPKGRKPYLTERFLNYTWGSEISFRGSDPGMVGASCLTGFSNPEANSTWTEKPEAEVRMIVPPADRDVILEARLGAFLKKGGQQSATIYANNKQVGRWLFPFTGTSRRQVTIPAGLIGEDGKLTVSFHIDNPARPSENVRWSDDTRLLGLDFSKMRLRLTGPGKVLQ